MARYIDAGDLPLDFVMSGFMAKQNNQEVRDYIKTSHKMFETDNRFINVSAGIKEEMQRAISVFDETNASILNITSRVDNIFTPERITLLDEENIHLTNGHNQLYIMANPVVNHYFQNNMCQAFVDSNTPFTEIDDSLTYFDSYIGFNKYFLNVRHGTAILCESDAVHNYHTYLLDTTEDEDNVIDEMSDRDRDVVLKNWLLCENMIKNGIDPTDLDKGNIGYLSNKDLFY